jgi:hypothetical protein
VDHQHSAEAGTVPVKRRRTHDAKSEERRKSGNGYALRVNPMRTIEDVLSRLRAEFLEMPGLRLKSEQVQRLCGIERTICQLVLDSLVDAKFLCVKSDGAYARVTDGEVSRPHAATADPRLDSVS